MTLKYMRSCLYLKVLDNFFSLTLRSITFVDYFTSYLYHYHFDLFFLFEQSPPPSFPLSFLTPFRISLSQIQWQLSFSFLSSYKNYSTYGRVMYKKLCGDEVAWLVSATSSKVSQQNYNLLRVLDLPDYL